MGQCYKIIFCRVWLGVLVVILVRYANSPRGGLVIVAAGGSGFCETLQKAAESVLMSLVTPGVVRVSEQGICRPQGRWRRLMSVCLSVCMSVCLSVCQRGRWQYPLSLASTDQPLHLVVIQTDIQEWNNRMLWRQRLKVRTRLRVTWKAMFLWEKMCFAWVNHALWWELG
jgi:hypothetical protein